MKDLDRFEPTDEHIAELQRIGKATADQLPDARFVLVVLNGDPPFFRMTWCGNAGTALAAKALRSLADEMEAGPSPISFQ